MTYFLGNFPASRLRRTRRAPWIRHLTAETYLTPHDLILPLFIREEDTPHEIQSLPGVYRFTLNELPTILEHAARIGIQAVALFPYIPDHLRSNDAEEALNPDNLLCQAIRCVKTRVPHMGVIADIALDLYTNHGHDGLVIDGSVDNDETVAILCRQALNAAAAGVDIVAPSDMMDGRVNAIRRILDAQGFQDCLVFSYSAKYCSAFYAPYRDAVGTGMRLGADNPVQLHNKRTYQMAPSNLEEALREVAQDITEGADMIMVKPAMLYLDVIQRIHQEFPAIPLFAFQVSGEYALFRNYPDFDHGQKMLMESLLSIKRAGARGIITYAAMEVAEVLKDRGFFNE